MTVEAGADWMSQNVGAELRLGVGNTPEDGRSPSRRGESLKSAVTGVFFENNFPPYSACGAAQVSETLASIYQTTRFHTPEESKGIP